MACDSSTLKRFLKLQFDAAYDKCFFFLFFLYLGLPKDGGNTGHDFQVRIVMKRLTIKTNFCLIMVIDL